jgi:hypothetical protein
MNYAYYFIFTTKQKTNDDKSFGVPNGRIAKDKILIVEVKFIMLKFSFFF